MTVINLTNDELKAMLPTHEILVKLHSDGTEWIIDQILEGSPQFPDTPIFIVHNAVTREDGRIGRSQFTVKRTLRR